MGEKNKKYKQQKQMGAAGKLGSVQLTLPSGDLLVGQLFFLFNRVGYKKKEA